VGTSEWTAVISDRLRLDVSITHDRGEPTNYSLNLRGLIDGDWVELCRYDNDHGNAHRHQFYPDQPTEMHNFIAMLPQTLIDKAQRDLKAWAFEYLDEYERRLANLERENS
jgi:hypothetical protein